MEVGSGNLLPISALNVARTDNLRMQQIRLAPIAATVSIIIVQSALAASPRDSFLQVDLSYLPQYRMIWASKLEVTPFDCGRFVVLPPFDPEVSVSVYSSRRADGTLRYRVTYIEASENMWQASDALRHLEKAKRINTRRIDADIPETTAHLVQQLWLRILIAPHPKASTTPRDRIPIDSPYFEWSLQRRNAVPLRVHANFYVQTTPVLKSLAELSDVILPAYCKASPGDRPAIARQIDEQAGALLRTYGQ
jgi:hypothetical protein